ncbi:MAG: membrane lipoprotein lipid attachment site-containing protein [Rikenellaceae bacterium]|nr:membrane lipoprotein lipid attachment site-containing protein [Rikenellaceae bacterium]
MKRILFTIGLLTFALTGCQQTDETPLQKPTTDKKVFVAQTENYNSSTKTTLDSDGQILWSETDQLAIFRGTSTATQYEVSNGAGTSYAEFTVVNNGDTGEWDGEWMRSSSDSFDANVALYPYALELTCTPTYENELLSYYVIGGVTLPSVQQYVANSFSEQSFVMAAITNSLSDDELKFKNVGGVLKLQLTGSAAIKSIALAGKANEPLAGNATIEVYPNGAAMPQIKMADDASTGVMLDCGENGVQLNNETPTIFMLAIPPTTFESGFTLTLTNTEGVTATLSTSKSNAVERSRVLAMPACEVEFEQPTANPDLSANGTANCYIVSAAGDYKFKATQGCSNAAVGTASVSAFAHPEGTPTQATVLWESFGNATKPEVGDLIKTVEYKDGYVHFSTADTFTEGNAVIDVKDANNITLWSWHIWLTDQPQEQIYKNNAGTMMDRNLGAISTTPGDVGALGLLYQWGRKDPLLSGETFDSNTAAAWTISYSLPQTEVTSSSGTVIYTIKNPLRYLWGYNSDWLFDSSDEHRWTRWGSVKTIYDPCPVGWQVPEKGVWRDAIGDDARHQFSSAQPNRGLNMSGSLGTDDVIWYPCAGNHKRNTGRLESVGSTASWWTTTINTNSSSPSPYVFRIGISSTGSSNNSYTCNASDYPIISHSVRCVKITD